MRLPEVEDVSSSKDEDMGKAEEAGEVDDVLEAEVSAFEVKEEWALKVEAG